MTEDDPYRTILGSGLGPWLISHHVRSWEWETVARVGRHQWYEERATSRKLYHSSGRFDTQVIPYLLH